MTAPIYIESAACWIPPAESAVKAVAEGRYSAAEHAANNILCLPVADDATAAPDMAVRAARRALDRTGDDSVDIVVHASLYHQGRDYFWTPAPYIQRELGISRAFAVNVQQMSNGGMAAFDLATAWLAAGRGTRALVTTADRFCPPGMDRWQGDYGIVYGDGATAMVLSTTGGFARVHAVESITDASLEPLHRGNQPFTSTPQATVDVRTAKRSFLSSLDGGVAAVQQRGEQVQTDLVRAVLARTGRSLGDFARVLLPNMGHALMNVHLKPLGIDPGRTLMDWGRFTGHLGAGDLIAGVARLVETRELRRGDHVLLIGAGGGYSLTVAAIEIETVPAWPGTTTDIVLPADLTEAGGAAS